MNLRIDKNSSEPAYIQLYNQLKNSIVSQAYPAGSRLPSKRQISAETGVSVITAEHAYDLLCEEGYAEARERSGIFVIYRAYDFQGTAADAEHAGHAGEHLPSTGGSDFPFTVLSKTMRRVLLDWGEGILVKSPNRGCPELTNEIAAYLARSRGIRVKPEQIVIGAGAEYLYSLIVQLLGTDGTYALEDPSYEKIQRVYRALGVQCEMLPMGTDGILSGALARSRARVLHVTPFDSFPSGATADISKKMEYMRWAQSRNAYIIEDNYASELTVLAKPEETLFSASAQHNVIYINTFSKTVAPSLRVGYMLLPEELLAAFQEKLGFYSCTVPVFEQYVLAELLRTGDFERHINRVRRRKRREAGQKL